MREIRFRAWTEGRMTYKPKCYNSDNLNGGCKYWGDLLMQYTGLKDKNGKEAFTEDIAEDEHGQRFVITWDYPLLARLQEIPFTVIGNLYENPELLQ